MFQDQAYQIVMKERGEIVLTITRNPAQASTLTVMAHFPARHSDLMEFSEPVPRDASFQEDTS